MERRGEERRSKPGSSVFHTNAKKRKRWIRALGRRRKGTNEYIDKVR
jgi:hypothetical protein